LPGTPAARYGLKAGDIVTEVDNTPLHDADGLVLNVGKLPAEAVTRLSVLRDGKTRVIEVTLTKYAVRGKKIVTTVDPSWRGLRVDYPSAVADEAGHLHEDRSFAADAVMVIEVAENSPTYAAGLRRGMLISHVDHLPVRTPKEFAAAVSKNAGPVQLRLAGDKKATPFIVEPKI
jgi:S1-C subfamily serine protease